MKKENVEFLKALLEAPSPSGFEQPAQRIVREHMSSFADEVRTDLHGNVIGVLNPDGYPRVMLAGHCDEIGFIVNHVEDNGFIRFADVGGWDTNIVVARRVHIHTRKGPVTGVIGTVPIHLQEERGKPQAPPKVHDLYIDIGAKDGKEAQRLVEIGDPITMAAGFEMLQNNLVVCRALDDKAGSFVVTEALRLCAEKRKSLKCALFSVSTVQEELGLRGGRTSAYSIDPQVGIAVDVTHASDCPGIEAKRTGKVLLGKGPVLHRGANINPVVGEGLITIAKRKRIPHQITAAPRATGTDANAIQISRGGVAAALVSIPNRYMHTPNEVCALADIDNSARLLAEYVLSLDKDADFTPK